MDPDNTDFMVSDVVVSLAGRDRDGLFYVIGAEAEYLILANGKDRPLDRPKRKKRRHVKKVLRAETRVAAKLLSGDKVLNSELRKDLAYLSRDTQSNNLGGF